MTILSPRRELGEFKKRYKWMALVTLLSFAILFLRIVQLQLIEHEKWDQIAENNVTKTVTIPATRGRILDTNANVVATNRPSYDVYLTPHRMQAEGRFARFSELMELDPDERLRLEARISGIPASRRTHQILMLRDITRDQLATLETHAAELSGVDVVASPARTYPYRTLGAHTVGYINEVNADDLARLGDDDYRAGDVIGRTGIEHAFESYLRGRRGFRKVVVDVQGVPIQAELDVEGAMYRPAMSGHDINLTMDMDLMRVVQRAFSGYPAGAVAVIDVHTGRVRAVFSKPSYDINEMAGRLTIERFAALRDDPFRPLIDKTVYESYFPGSTFKPITAFAALGDEVVDPTATVNCPGYYELGNRRFRCTAAHGEVDMQQSLVRSCNVYFWRLAEQVGLERLNRYARRFGLGDVTGIGINSEAGGFLATREWYESTYGRFHTGHTLNAAIGQGNTRSTVVQIATAYASIANGGTLFVPQLVERISTSEGEVVQAFEPRVRREVGLTEEHVHYVMEGLLGVVNELDGTAYDARIPGGVLIAGKTGTAEVARYRPRDAEDANRSRDFNRSHAWFAGYAPADDPEVAIAVLVEHGGGGGRAAAPIAIQILQEYLGARIAQAPVDAASGEDG